jgi:cysteine protease ATG4
MENTLANVDLGRYRRIVQMFWDPEPVNDPSIDQPVWCLGCSYRLNDAKQTEPTKYQRQPASVSAEDHPKPDSSQQDRAQHIKVDVPPSKAKSDDNDNEHEPVIQDVTDPNPTKPEQVKSVTTPPPNAPDTPPESASSSFSSSLAYDDSEQGGSWPHAFIEDFESRLWMTYRSDFEPIAKSSDPKANSALSLSMRIKSQLGDQAGFSSDSGWGCMIRSGQSLLANTIALLRLGRDWRRGSLQQDERELLRMFADDPRAPYSIHSFVHHGAVACGKYPGEWFGPSATARCIQALTNINEPLLKVYCTGDGPDVYEDSFMKVAKPDGTFHPTLLLVSTRLGIDKITPVYWEALIASLQMSQSVGIAG